MDAEFSKAEPKVGSLITNGSSSNCTPRFRPSFFRYARHEFLFKSLLVGAFVIFLLGMAVGGSGERLEPNADRGLAGLGSTLKVMGGLALLLAFHILVLTRWLWKRTAVLFKDGLLIPGIVLSSLPLEVAVMATMNDGPGVECWGIRRLKLSSLPVHNHDAGTRVPFVSTYLDGDRSNRWDYFNLTPISYGTGSRKRIEGCVQKLGQERFDRLAECIRHGLVPLLEEEINLVDEHFHRLKTVSRNQPPAS